MSIERDVTELAQAIQACDHADPAVRDMHALAWVLVWRHKDLLGMSDEQLLALGQGDTQARGGGTDKTKPQ